MVTHTRLELVLPTWEAGVLTARRMGQKDGAPCRSRTYDPIIKSDMLYQLS